MSKPYTLLLILAFHLSGCSLLTPSKEELVQIKQAREKATQYTKTNIIDPITSLAFSTCQHRVKTGRWHVVNFKRNKKSSFAGYKNELIEDQHVANFSLNTSAYDFRMTISKTDIDELDYLFELYGTVKG